MKKILSFGSILVITIAILGLSFLRNSKEISANAEETIVFTSAEEELVDVNEDSIVTKGNNTFGFNLMNSLINKDEDKNIIISPFSISSAIAMTQNGAKEQTKQEILKTLGFEGASDETISREYYSIINYFNGLKSTSLKIADSIWIQKNMTVEKTFLDASKSFFNAEVANVDFQNGDLDDILAQINKWIEKNTDGQIKKGIDSLDKDNRAILINALNFKGQWENEFYPESTTLEKFTLSSGEKISVPTMKNICTTDYLKGDNFQGVKLPYHDGFEMDLFKPNEGIAINDFIKNITKNNFDKWSGEFSPKEIRIAIPKFKLDYSEDEMKDSLIELGIKQAFDPQKANFSGIKEIVDYENLYIDKVIHKTAVDVNENGTTASAATVVEIKAGGKPSVEAEFLIDRPFVFVIRDTKTGMILFIGKVENPLKVN